VHFIFSFYSIIDLLAILPFYVAAALPGSWVDQYAEMFRMLHLLRLVKLDKYFPSIILIDDVIRLKWNALRIAGFAAVSLWIIFAGLLYLTEHTDTTNGIDNVPLYGCSDDCTMSDRYVF
jgi:voltage-gated potassium channel